MFDPRMMGMIPGGGMTPPPGFASTLGGQSFSGGPIPVDQDRMHGGFGQFPGMQGGQGFPWGGFDKGNAMQGWQQWLQQLQGQFPGGPFGGGQMQPMNMMQMLMPNGY